MPPNSISERVLKTGDVLLCMNEIKKYLEEDSKITIGVVESIANMLARFSTKVFIPIEYSEILLSSVGKMLEENSDERILLFSSSSSFTQVIISLVVDYSMRVRKISPIEHEYSSFSSHFCYKVSLYILLGMIEKAILIKSFVKNIDAAELMRLVKALSAILPMDSQFLTQVILPFVIYLTILL